MIHVEHVLLQAELITPSVKAHLRLICQCSFNCFRKYCNANGYIIIMSTEIVQTLEADLTDQAYHCLEENRYDQ